MASANPMLDPLFVAMSDVAKAEPTAVMIVWEDAKGVLSTRTVPRSKTLERGFLERIYSVMNSASDLEGDDDDAE